MKQRSKEGLETPLDRMPPDGVLDKAVSVGLWALGGSFALVALPTMTMLNRAVGPDAIEPINRFYCRTQIALTFSRWKATVDPSVPERQPCLFVQNHTNHFDHVMAYCATKHRLQGIELEDHFRYPVYGWFMKSRGTIPVNPKLAGHSERLLSRVREEMSLGRSILAFPEAHRTLDGRVAPFRTGIFRVAIAAGLPIVPVSVTGSFEVMRKGSLTIHPGNDLQVWVDAPIPVSNLVPEDAAQLAEQAQSVISRRIDDYWSDRLSNRRLSNLR